MPLKKKTTITQEVTGESKNPYRSYFMDKIFPSFVTLAIGAVGALVVMYFTVSALSLRVNALETEAVKKDVFVEVIEPMKDDISDIKENTEKIDDKLDRLIENRQVQTRTVNSIARVTPTPTPTAVPQPVTNTYTTVVQEPQPTPHPAPQPTAQPSPTPIINVPILKEIL